MSDEQRPDAPDDFEAHKKKWLKSEDAEPAEDHGEVEKREDDDDEPDFELHRKKF